MIFNEALDSGVTIYEIKEAFSQLHGDRRRCRHHYQCLDQGEYILKLVEKCRDNLHIPQKLRNLAAQNVKHVGL